jgi:DNA-binding MarR family transcriptional regulator
MPEEQRKITLGLLNAVHENSNVTQRNMARNLGVALGLVNAYLKRCINKGFVKIRHVPANRYAYYLTPAGFSEKSRLTAEYLSSSFNFFRNARRECARILGQCEEFGHRKIILAGASDLAEIVFLCTQEHSLEIVAVIDPGTAGQVFLTLPVFEDISAAEPFDAAIVTSLTEPQAVYDGLVADLPPEQVFTPSILGITRQAEAARAGEAR